MGARVSLPMIERSDDLGGGAELVWVVDSDRCDGCFGDGVAAWNALAADSSLRRHLLVVGAGGVLRDVLPSALIRNTQP